MSDKNYLHLVYEPKRSSHVKDSLYHMMTGSSLKDEWEIKRSELSDAGFELVHDAVKASVECKATFHHHPSGSTLLFENCHFTPGVKIFGRQRESAKEVLVNLVRPYGFNLEQRR